MIGMVGWCVQIERRDILCEMGIEILQKAISFFATQIDEAADGGLQGKPLEGDKQ